MEKKTESTEWRIEERKEQKEKGREEKNGGKGDERRKGRRTAKREMNVKDSKGE